eukprot:CAMPEP_0114502618 /NCGR_PEP_ID=MMETSP0109-20121206/9195_1 /TAXON_ID=29199 /ORGANISM="Chlorarachnion reptans, Strain CCCM449" /LENGTH=115 /DNA_ID=CAMNT_0001680561 /DNA_START=37 /DNA_END=382 /DNA_ORIENTATION=+
MLDSSKTVQQQEKCAEYYDEDDSDSDDDDDQKEEEDTLTEEQLTKGWRNKQKIARILQYGVSILERLDVNPAGLPLKSESSLEQKISSVRPLHEWEGPHKPRRGEGDSGGGDGGV